MPPRSPASQTQPVCAGQRFLLHTGRIQRQTVVAEIVVCRLCPAATTADITRIRRCVGTTLSYWLRTLRPAPRTKRLFLHGPPQSHHLLSHFLHLGLDDFSASLALLSHCYQFLPELFRQVLAQPLAVFHADQFFHSGSLPPDISLPLTSESAIVHAYSATSLAKLYHKTPDTTCYEPPSTQHSRATHTSNHWARQGTQKSLLQLPTPQQQLTYSQRRRQDSIQDGAAQG
ncbi:hypothetical protein E2C01_052517 [Portunus trituberculatus]|uniref:Uncharacterized protein n=1 Tax=Portunus trituberculatus TaxID=210409 RepID=A0A5B7GLR3_PORTR|nr:hypothetical protein [Portunus trituberculatus]